MTYTGYPILNKWCEQTQPHKGHTWFDKKGFQSFCAGHS